jgi:serine/threonine protein phosphatase PrpC
VPRLGQKEISWGCNMLELKNGDQLIFCSDGLRLSYITEQIMLEVISNSSNNASACSQLIHLANKNGGNDNITVIIGTVYNGILKEAKPDNIVLNDIQIVQEFDSTTSNLT